MVKKGSKVDIEVVIKYTKGWEERIAKAAYNLYQRKKKKEASEKQPV